MDDAFPSDTREDSYVVAHFLENFLSQFREASGNKFWDYQTQLIYTNFSL